MTVQTPAEVWAALVAYLETPEFDFDTTNANERFVQDEKSREPATEAIARLMVSVTGLDPEEKILRPQHKPYLGWMGERVVYERDLVPAWFAYRNLAHALVGALWGAKRKYEAQKQEA